MSGELSELRDGMRIDWDVPMEMDDGVVLRADVFRPPADGRYPVILSYGPYGKGLAFQDGYPTAWQAMIEAYPEVAAGSTNQYQAWEVVDPERWVPDGYAVVRVDSRGAGRSPGYIDHFSAREAQDLYRCIEWAGVALWSNGKVGLNGISYYASTQWLVAPLQPPHLAAMCVWEGAADFYRERARHGGILSSYPGNWYDKQVKTVQYGLGERGPASRNTGRPVCGDVTLSDEELAANRCDYGDDIFSHPFDDDHYRSRSAAFDRITTPLLSAGNWGGQGLHLRGNVEGFGRAASDDKWLELHGLEHWTQFYTDGGVGLQKRFFGHFLKGENNGWAEQPRVLLRVRHLDHFEDRGEEDWPVPRTEWTRLFLDAGRMTMDTQPPSTEAAVSFEALGPGATFMAHPRDEEMELTGPIAAKLHVGSSTTDTDIFLVVRLFGPDGEEVTFQGAIDPHTPIAQGWLRASRRDLDPRLSRPWRPFHRHQAIEPLVPGEVYELHVEVWPTSIVIPPGYRLGLTVLGRDYEWGGDTSGLRLSQFKNELRGCGPFLHDDPRDRPPEIYGGTTLLHTGPDHPAHLLLPVIPPAG